MALDSSTYLNQSILIPLCVVVIQTNYDTE